MRSFGLATILTLALCLPAAAQTFAFIADISQPSYGREAPALAAIAAHDPAALFILGDAPHPGDACGTITPAKVRRMYCEVHGCDGTGWPIGRDWRAHVADLPTYAIYSDHESLCNNSDRLSPGMATLRAAHQAFYPAPYPSPNGVWHTVVLGHVRVIMLDTRAQREPSPLDGPTAFLGAEQTAWFETVLASATERWIVIGLDAPTTGKVKDAFASKPQALARFTTALEASCHGRCVTIAGDYHLGGAIRRTSWGVEISVPHLNMGTGIQRWGSCGGDGLRPNAGCGTWDAIIQGRGRPGYGLVTATADALTVEARSATGVVRLSMTLP